MPVRRWRWLTWPAVVLLLLAYATFISSTEARADESLTPTADTFVNGLNPDRSLGTLSSMRSDDSPKISYVKFPAPAAAGTATLRIWGQGAQNPVPFDVHKIPNTWSESTTYNTRPTLGAKVGSGTVVSNGYASVNVGSVSGVTSFAIVRPNVGSDAVFSTRETTNDPRLVVVTSPPNPATDTAAATPPPPSKFTSGCVGKPWQLVDGKFPLDWTWRAAHDAYGGRAAAAFNTFVSSGTATLACAHGHNHEDGWHPREDPFPTNRGTVDIHDAYFTGLRDDCIENDNFMPGRITNVLCDGTFSFHSEQVNGGGTPDTIGPNESRVLYLDRVYARLHDNNASSAATIGRWFKTEPSVENHTLDITDSVFALNEPPRMADTGEIRWNNLNFPSGTVFHGTNYILWLGPVGGYQGPKPAGVTFLEGQAALDKWNYHRNGWLAAHCLPTRPANDLTSVDDPLVAPSC